MPPAVPSQLVARVMKITTTAAAKMDKRSDGLIKLVYEATKNKVFCEVCTTAKNMGAPLPSTTHDQESLKAFVRDGFSSWAKALERFRFHEKSNLHRATVSIVAAANVGVNVAGKQKQMAMRE